MEEKKVKTLEGNEAVAYVAYRINEVCAIYPITPSSTMAELADQWAMEGKTNIWGQIPMVMEMQSEAGAAGALHGALQTGSMTTTFTASQGLLLMIPNMYKIAGELNACVFHVAARAIAAQGLSIFGDHSDVAAVRMTGFAQLASGSVQEAHDMALISQAATLESRIPFIHFFDGFRTSHEVSKIFLLSDAEIHAMIDEDRVREHRARALNPDHPFMRGTAQNPDTYFQGRESVNSYYNVLPDIVQKTMDKFAKTTGRSYNLVEYFGHPEAERLAVIVGSGGFTMRETIRHLQKQGEKTGMIQIRLCLPFPTEQFIAAIPKTVRSIAVLDRTKAPGSTGEPLYGDVVSVITEAFQKGRLKIEKFPNITGGRYGLSSKEFTPAMAKAVMDEIKKENPKNSFTVGINDDVTHTSLVYDASLNIEHDAIVRCIFYGLGADGTVGANKNTIKIIGESTDLFAQGYFVYDSKKSGSQTISHLRFGPEPIEAPYLIESADFIGCHQFQFIEKTDVLSRARFGGIFLLNSPFDAAHVWEKLPREVQQQMIDLKLKFHVIDASGVARETGMPGRTNTIMQTCFFALSGVLPREKAIEKIKESIKKTYGKKGEHVVNENFAAVDKTLARLQEVKIPERADSSFTRPAAVPAEAPEFVQKVTAMMLSGRGDELPVSALPVDGTFPLGTTQWEKRNIAQFVPVWENDICIQCGNCSFVCPHSVIRAKFFHESHLKNSPVSFKSAGISARGFPETKYSLIVYGEDCTGCGLCVEVCPAKSLQVSGVKAINMKPRADSEKTEKADISFFESIPVNNRARVDFSSVRGTQFLEPMFEFSGACAGCGETPYVKLLSQLFGDRLIVANATGCSSIYGGNLPTTPWRTNSEGRGPAWSNSLFEDNAEFGLGFRLTADQHLNLARRLLAEERDKIDSTLVREILKAPQETETQIRAQRERVAKVKGALLLRQDEDARNLLSVIDHLVRRSIWIIGGDGWAYDIGSGGLDHVLATGRNVNVLVLDTEVYSNTGGQASKSTPLGAVAKFASGGKPVAKKDLALQAIAYGNVYVARIAMGANPQQTLLAFREAEAYSGPSIILAYSHCIAHGIDMHKGLKQQDMAVASGHWPLLRYNPVLRSSDKNPFVLDSTRPRIRFTEYSQNELRYKILSKSNPGKYKRLMEMAQQVVDQKWEIYEDMATRGGSRFLPDASLIEE